jgi:hypothetical protein
MYATYVRRGLVTEERERERERDDAHDEIFRATSLLINIIMAIKRLMEERTNF